jgi:hypothetical protein
MQKRRFVPIGLYVNRYCSDTRQRNKYQSNALAELKEDEGGLVIHSFARPN